MEQEAIQLKDGQYLMYRGKPLVRDQNQICYGDMNDPYVLHLMILNTKKLGDQDVPDTVLGEVCSTDTTKSSAERSVRQFQKNGLYESLEYGISQLDFLNKKKG